MRSPSASVDAGRARARDGLARADAGRALAAADVSPHRPHTHTHAYAYACQRCLTRVALVGCAFDACVCHRL